MKYALALIALVFSSGCDAHATFRTDAKANAPASAPARLNWSDGAVKDVHTSMPARSVHTRLIDQASLQSWPDRCMVIVTLPTGEYLHVQVDDRICHDPRNW